MAIKNSKADALPTLDKAHYLKIAKEGGLYRAITELHHELKTLERECFEGPKGYRPDLYDRLKDYRDFSRSLWLLNVDHGLDTTVADIEKKRNY